VDGELLQTVTGLEGAIQPGKTAAGLIVGGPSGDSFVGLVDNLHIISHALTDRQAKSDDPIKTWQNDARMWVAATDVSYATIRGSSAADNLTGTSADDVINGVNGHDMIGGGSGKDILIGDDGNDTLAGGAGADMLNGGDGFDLLDYSASTRNVKIDLSQGTAAGGDAAGDIFTGVEGVLAGAGNDKLIGNNAANRLEGGDGNDIISGGAGADVLNGGAGVDHLDFRASASGVTVNLKTGLSAGGDAEGDEISGFENIIGSRGGDTLSGSDVANYLNGMAGNDAINGGSGADVLLGGAGNDTVVYSGSGSGVIVNLGANTASGGDATGDDISGFENALGSAFADTLIGSDGNNTLNGGAGNDRLQGGRGTDKLIGDAGSDTFVFTSLLDSGTGSARDLVHQFSQAEGDRIDVSAIATGHASGAFHLTASGGTGAFTGSAGELRYFKSGSLTIIQLDSNGDGSADSEIGLSGNYTLTSVDFIL
jgi:Ca2+-binding RTX toxin-like protein